MAAALHASGLMCCSQPQRLRGGKRFMSGQCLTARCPGTVRPCARVGIAAAARDTGDDSNGRNRIGRSMDDNASTDEPWWKQLLPGQKRQAKPSTKPIGNSLNGKYNVARAPGAGKSGIVSQSAGGGAAAAEKTSVQPPRRFLGEPTEASRRAGGAAGARKRSRPSSFPSSREAPADPDYASLTYDSSADDDTFRFQFNNTFTSRRDDKPERCDDAVPKRGDSCTDGSGSKEGGSWLGGLLDGSSGSSDTTANADDTGGWSFGGGHGHSHDTGSSGGDDTGSSHSSHDTSSYSSSWDSGSHHSHDTSSYDTSSYDSGGGDSGGGDCGGGGD